MKSLSQLMVAVTVLLSFTACNAQNKNKITETIHIYGNCGMCKSTIEKAGNQKKIAKVDWNASTKMATITYDAKKTSQDEILKRIALAGYDSDKYLAPNDVYAKLPGCCQYERKSKPLVKVEETKVDSAKTVKQEANEIIEYQSTANQLQPVFDNYFLLKDNLVKSDAKSASAAAKELLVAINSVKMNVLTSLEHTVWMKVMKDLAFDAGFIADSKNIADQRKHLPALSKNMYELMKVSTPETPVFYQNCPMYNDGKGANWLSKENTIKNPYYGAQMLSCGKTIESIK